MSLNLADSINLADFVVITNMCTDGMGTGPIRAPLGGKPDPKARPAEVRFEFQRLLLAFLDHEIENGRGGQTVAEYRNAVATNKEDGGTRND